MLISFWIEVLASILTLVHMVGYGRKKLWGPGVGLIAGVAWFAVIALAGTWGMLVLHVPAAAINAFNFWKWSREDVG